MSAQYDDVVLAAPVTVPYAKFSIHGAQYFLGRALRGLLGAAGLERGDIDGLCVSSFSLVPDSGIGLARALGMELRWLDTIPLGGASGIVALRRAARAVQCGDARFVACMAGDTNHPGGFRENTARFTQATQDAVHPIGAGGPTQGFALITDAYMRKTGCRAEDFGTLCIAQRDNAAANPLALLRTPLSMEAYLASRPISTPLRMLDCVMPCAGAEAFLVMRRADAVALALPYCKLLAASERHNAFADDPIQSRGGWERDATTLYAQARRRPADIDLVQTYDDYPVMSFIQFENLGFAPPGAAADFVAAHDLRAAGDFPVNTGGGQLSVGQAGAAGGFLGINEAIRQLTGRATGAQVVNARTGLVSGFGMIAYDRGLSAGAAILEAA